MSDHTFHYNLGVQKAREHMAALSHESALATPDGAARRSAAAAAEASADSQWLDRRAAQLGKPASAVKLPPKPPGYENLSAIGKRTWNLEAERWVRAGGR